MALVNAIARTHDLETSAVFDGPIPLDRSNLGWTQPDVSSIYTYLGSKENDRRELIDRLGPEAIHVFFGFHAYPGVFSAMKYCAAIGRKFFVWMEPVNVGRWSGIVKRLIYNIHARRFDSSLQGVFVTGTMGFPFLLKCGFAKKKLIPFCYPISGRAVGQFHVFGRSSEFRVIFIGQLIPLKRVDLLITALSRVDAPNFRATIVGDGPERTALEKLALRLGLGGAVVFMQSTKNAQILDLLQGHDLLVLPSEFDGWGFVVNEALSQGTPVLISDRCGSQDFVKDQLCGEVFPHASLSSLVDVLNELISKDKRSLEVRDRLLDKVRRQMSEEVVASFMVQSMFALERSSTRPPAPWLK